MKRSPTVRAFPRRIEIAALVLPVMLLAALLLLDYLLLERLLSQELAHVVTFVLGIGGIVAFSYAIFDRLSELQAHERQQADALDRRGRQLQALNEAGISLAAELDSATVLQKIVELARDVAGARYAALGIFNENGEVMQFLTSGITSEQRARIGGLPRGRGLLGLLQDEQRPMRLRSIAEHPVSVGFPKEHPPMNSFLGVPILWRGRSVGNLYLTEKIGAAEFTAEDEEAIVTLAAQAAIAIENARLYEQVGRISVLEERQRIGMDLHDGAMQSLYGVGLLLEDAADRLPAEAQPARPPIERAVELLNGTIAEMRRYVTGLRPIRGAERPLSESLPTLATQLGEQAHLKVTVDVDPDAERELDPEQREAAFYVAADALTNVARHARARTAQIRFSRRDGSAVLEVLDDGIGFDPASRAPGLGLRNMRERAFVAGGRLHVGSVPGQGTSIRLELPVERRVEECMTDGQPTRVMIVDDHEVVREGLRTLIGKQQGMSIVGEAATAKEAIETAARARPDVVIMDVRLPDGSGIEACRAIREARPSTGVIMLTSYADDEALFASILAGAAGYLLKDAKGQTVLDAITAVAAGRSLLDPTVTGKVLERVRKGPEDDPGLASLTEQERKVLEHVAEGKTNREIGAAMFLSEKTVKNYVSRILDKLGLARRAEAAAYMAKRRPRY